MDSAERIVEIQSLLARGHRDSTALLSEQRTLWDRDHSGRAFDAIARDVWLVKRARNY